MFRHDSTPENQLSSICYQCFLPSSKSRSVVILWLPTTKFFPLSLPALIFPSLPSKVASKCHCKTLPSSSTCFPFLLLSPTASSSGKSSFPSIKDKIHPTQRRQCQVHLSLPKNFTSDDFSPLLLLQSYSFHNTFQQWPQPDSFTTANLYQHLMYFMCLQCFFWVCNRLQIPWSMSHYISV